jgi:hypothetical protein
LMEMRLGANGGGNYWNGWPSHPFDMEYSCYGDGRTLKNGGPGPVMKGAFKWKRVGGVV